MLLGQIHFEMRNLPQAGRYWLLTPVRGDLFEAAMDAFHEKYGGSADDILRALRSGAPSPNTRHRSKSR